MQVNSSKILEEKRPLMKKLLAGLLETYTYASILAVDAEGKSYAVSRAGINIAKSDVWSECGYVIKVYDGESYGEYAFNHLEEDQIDGIVTRIKEQLMPWKEALAAGLCTKQYPRMDEEEASFEKSTECGRMPGQMGDGEVIEKLKAVRDKALTQREDLIDCRTACSYQVAHKIFLSPKKELAQNVMWTTGVLVAMAAKGEEIKTSFASCGGLCGLETLDEMEGLIPGVMDSIGYLLVSEPMVPGEYDCICTPEVTGMIVHEAFGHGVEMDMFVKKRALAEKYVGEYVASPLVTMHDGAAVAIDQSATFFFDDEGTPAQDTIVIDHGVLKGGICDAQAGMALHCAPTGNGRRQSTDHKAYTRMTNTYFEGGNDKLEDMIASIENGVMLCEATSGMEDPKNWGIQCMVNYAREIKNGKFTGRVFSPIVLTGYVPDLLKSISMMSETPKLSGAGMCGKGHKEWVKVSDGGPYIKARIRLG